MENISKLLGKWFIRDHTKLPLLAAADDDTSQDNDGTWCYYRIAKDGSMNHVLLHVMLEDEKVQKQIALFQLPSFKYIIGNTSSERVLSL